MLCYAEKKNMNFLKRTHAVHALNASCAGKEVILNGWVHRLRDHGQFVFVNLRDRSGLVQCVVGEGSDEKLFTQIRDLGNEYCIAVRGKVVLRPQEMRNTRMATGEIEVHVEECQVLGISETPPFVIEDEATKAKEDLRLKYRYLDLRSGVMQHNIRLRHQVTMAVRNYLDNLGFWEIETPVLIRSTPEGARDFVVPSRIYPGQFFALPQSPQLYKQILMSGGMEKYFQIARCFRDEDPRGDRQPEFTQIDIEMSFVDREDVLSMTEGLMCHIFKEVKNIDLPVPFPRLSYHEAMNTYGVDKPDLRFEMKLFDVADLVQKSDFDVMKQALAQEGYAAKGLILCGDADGFSRKKAFELENMAKKAGLGGLAWMKYTAQGLEGGASKFFAAHLDELKRLGLQEGDVLLLATGPWQKVCTALGNIRQKYGQEKGLCDKETFAFCWVLDFPLFEFNEETKEWTAAHHMFTMPQKQFLETMESDPGAVLGDLYDLVLNGYELASGSIRIHDPQLQKRVFNIVGYSEETARDRFGFLLESFQYGAPPHGGIAPGLDRLVMLMCGQQTIREVIAFPKNTQGVAPLEGAPGEIDELQWHELQLKRIIQKH